MIDMPNGSSEARTINVEPRKYRVQRINGLPNNMINPPKKVLERIIIENKKIKKVRMRDSNFSFWKSGFVWPAKGRISGVYGSQRILNGRPKQPHYGIDIAAPRGSLVVAPTGGVVALAEPDLYYSGGTIIIDHGHGLTSAFLHMDKLFVVVGDVVSQSQLIGTIGSTGRSTGPHLDWRINWFEKRIDPSLLVE
jgi:murein DD-endopeptidase MepM/ murein hydrolase activator NlpD